LERTAFDIFQIGLAFRNYDIERGNNLGNRSVEAPVKFIVHRKVGIGTIG